MSVNVSVAQMKITFTFLGNFFFNSSRCFFVSPLPHRLEEINKYILKKIEQNSTWSSWQVDKEVICLLEVIFISVFLYDKCVRFVSKHVCSQCSQFHNLNVINK